MHGQISMAIQPSLGSIPNNKDGVNGHKYTGVFFMQQTVEPRYACSFPLIVPVEIFDGKLLVWRKQCLHNAPEVAPQLAPCGVLPIPKQA